MLKIQHSSDKYVWCVFRKRHTSGVLAWHLVKKRHVQKRWERRRCDDLVCMWLSPPSQVGLNSHWFSYGHQPHSRDLYTHYMDSLSKLG